MTPSLADDIAEVLISEAAIEARVRELAAEISRDYAENSLHLVGVLRGATIFLADLVRRLTIPVTFDFIAISSYGADTRSTGIVRLVKDLDESVESRHVLIVEDVVDTGLTLNYLLEVLRQRKAASVEVCALLDKPARRRVSAAAKYVGFTVPDAFVVGYGLDYAQRYRNLPYIGALRPEVYGG